MGKGKIKWKIFAFLLAFCTVLLLILWMFQTVFLDSFYRAIRERELKSSVTLVAERIGSDTLAQLLENEAQTKEVYTEVLEMDGTTLFSADIPTGSFLQKIPVAEKQVLIAEAKKNGGELSRYIDAQRVPARPEILSPPQRNQAEEDKPPMQALVYVRLVQKTTGETVAVLSSSLLSPVDATVATLKTQLVVITGIMVACSVILALLMARYVARPIEKVTKGAQKLAEGDYDADFSAGGYREVEQLSQTLGIAAREMSKVEEYRRELLANVSHDLRTPLSLIYSYAEMMQDFPAEITKEQIQVIMDETTRLTTLVNDILALSKLEEGAGELHLSKFNLSEMIQEINTRIGTMVEQDGYTIQLKTVDDLYVWADKTKITQVYYNLLLNAITHTGTNKTVTVHSFAMENKVRVEVTDTGEGVAPQDIAHIWERYYKVDKEHKRSVTGSGLGLSIVKKIIEQHHGLYGVCSHNGEGSTFWFELEQCVKS